MCEVETVTGVFEIPSIITFAKNKFDGYIALGCVIRGETTHYDYVCQESARALMNLSLEGLALGYGIITTENYNQALARSITGETFSNDRRKAVEDFSNNDLEVLVNFNIFSTGFDDPLIDCVIIARPTFSVVLYSQMVGRGLRGPRNGGTESCLLINVVDNILNLPDIEHACNYFDADWER